VKFGATPITSGKGTPGFSFISNPLAPIPTLARAPAPDRPLAHCVKLSRESLPCRLNVACGNPRRPCNPGKSAGGHSR
jgi:hypothetical protein